MSTRYRLTIAARVLLASLMLGLAALPLRAQEPAQGTASGTTVTEPDADAPVVLRVPWVQSPGFGGLTRSFFGLCRGSGPFTQLVGSGQ